MAAGGNSLSGGVTLVHTEQEGKHSYEVMNFISSNKGFFARGGDKILMVNGEKTEDLAPQEFVNILVEGSPLLTIHHPRREKTKECLSEEIRAYKKEPTVMDFSLTMVREEDLHPEGHREEPEPEPDWEEYIKDDNRFFVSMTETSLTLVIARGCDPESPCHNCGRTDCQFNEVVVMPERAEIVFNGDLIVNQIKERNNLFLKSLLLNKYVTPWKEQLLLGDTMSAKITIYYYKMNILDRNSGSPVVLNFTGTNNFFCCTTKEGDNKKMLRVVCHDRSDLKNICADDPEKWSLVFYMSSTLENNRRFESALHRGWFIYIQNVNSDEVEMKERNPYNQTNFYFVIETQT
ncbi:uncharacterized protein LOC130410322 [Triplophysa dalaica]|uniref:uncharacterized protein LOC130410322 n=1 Tax=Triplophysa dalaica TaxID=1582913 RepID=UPI0024E036CF|nr:uncharacterized protein LOC130410322 [Triplophysa dalaica]